jgi:hypothetical protein
MTSVLDRGASMAGIFPTLSKLVNQRLHEHEVRRHSTLYGSMGKRTTCTARFRLQIEEQMRICRCSAIGSLHADGTICLETRAKSAKHETWCFAGRRFRQQIGAENGCPLNMIQSLRLAWLVCVSYQALLVTLCVTWPYTHWKLLTHFQHQPHDRTGFNPSLLVDTASGSHS